MREEGGEGLSELRINIAEEGEPGDEAGFRTDVSKSVLVDRMTVLWRGLHSIPDEQGPYACSTWL